MARADSPEPRAPSSESDIYERIRGERFRMRSSIYQYHRIKTRTLLSRYVFIGRRRAVCWCVTRDCCLALSSSHMRAHAFTLSSVLFSASDPNRYTFVRNRQPLSPPTDKHPSPRVSGFPFSLPHPSHLSLALVVNIHTCTSHALNMKCIAMVAACAAGAQAFVAPR